MSRVTSDLIEIYFEDFPALNQWEDLLQKSKDEAERTGVDFMSLSFAESSLVAQTLQIVNSSNPNQPMKWVEIGSLTGFSALCLLSALGDQTQIWALEKAADRAVFLRELFSDPRLRGRIHVVEGDSRETKKTIESHGPFDGVFIDGAKSEYLNDLEWAEVNVKKGGWILADNVFLSGVVFDPQSRERGSDRFSAKQIQAMHQFLSRVSDPTRYSTLVLPTSDGLSVSRKLF